MLQNYPLMALRALLRHKLYSFINIVGMSVALACAILILLFVGDQLSYDTWIPHAENLFRLEETLNMLGRPPMPLAKSPFGLLTQMKEEIPEVAAITHVDLAKVTIGGRGAEFLDTATVVDPDFLDVIGLPLIAGDPARVLANSGSVVLSQSEARRFFGDADPVGKILTIGGLGSAHCRPAHSSCAIVARPFTVTGVLRDLPHNTQLIAGIVVPNTYQTPPQAQTGGLDYGYVRLAPGASRDRVLAEVRSILNRSFNPRKFGLNQSASDLEQMHLFRFQDVHLTDGRDGEMKPAGSRPTVYGLAIIALLIVVMASCNFMNLATAMATFRMREVVLRKLTGATRFQVFAQFLIEAIMAVVIALIIALALVEMVLPLYASFLGASLDVHYLKDWKAASSLLLGGVAIGALSGLYPALMLSSLRPAAALQGKVFGADSALLRSALVVGQFAVSIGLGVAMIIVFRQMNFVRSLALGFDRYDMVVVRGTRGIARSVMEEYARVVEAGPGIAGAALSSAVPFDPSTFVDLIVRSPGGGNPITAKFVSVDPGFTTVYRVPIVAGRPFAAAFGSDETTSAESRNVLVNAALAQRFGYSPQEAVGKTLTGGPGRLEVVGVVGDAMFDGVRELAQPMVFLDDPGAGTFLSIRVQPERIPQALSFVDGAWRSLAPGVAMDRYFLSTAFSGLLADDDRQGDILGVFVVIAVLIAALGLFGLAVFTAERRTKEIGIRKVSGARTSDIVRLMLWRTSVPVLAANVVAWPVAYYCLRRWLESYAYRVTLDPVYFLAAGAVALLIAWATVYANTLRLARISPVHALRYE
ncbi:MAG: ABC transporter permease [Steroidobacteraceae bacterium]